MTTPILEPLLAVTAAAPVSAQREASVVDRAFRDLLVPPRKMADDTPMTKSRAMNDESPRPPVCCAPPASDDGPATDEQDEHEEEESRDSTAIAATSATPAVLTEPNAEAVAIDATTENVAETTALEKKRESRPAALELPSDELPNGEAANVRAVQVDVAETADAVEVTPDNPQAVEYLEALAVSSTQEVADAASVTVADEEASGTTEADIPSAQHSTKDAVKTHRDSQQQEHSPLGDQQAKSSNERELANTQIGAGQVAEPTAPAKRPTGRTRETEKREARGVGDVGTKKTADTQPEANSLNVPEKPAPSSSTIAVATETTSAANPNVAIEAAPAHAEASAAHGAPSATADRLETMLAQRRVKMSASGHGPALTESQQTRLVQRVARAFETARMRGDAEIRLRLSPPELGSLKLEVRMESGVMTARLEVETVAAQQALADNLGTLRQRLAEQNIRIEQFDVDLMDRHNGNSSDSPTSQSNHDERQSQRSATRTPQSQRNSQPVSSVAETRTATRSSGGLDVLI